MLGHSLRVGTLILYHSISNYTPLFTKESKGERLLLKGLIKAIVGCTVFTSSVQCTVYMIRGGVRDD